MSTNVIKRGLTFVAWADASERKPVDLDVLKNQLQQNNPEEQVLAHGGALTAIDQFKCDAAGVQRFQLLALHDAENAPSEWGPGAGATPISLKQGCYTAFITHVMIWPDRVAAFDRHPNAPGLSRLATYVKERAGERIVFRALYERDLKARLEDLRGARGIEYSIHDPHKRAALARQNGMFASLLPTVSQRVPTVRVAIGMGRKGPRDAYLPDELHDQVIEMADHAEEFFDSLIIGGHSKSEVSASGKPKSVKINLLSERLQIDADLPRSADMPNLPERKAVYRALRAARQQLDQSGRLQDAVEARMVLDGG